MSVLNTVLAKPGRYFQTSHGFSRAAISHYKRSLTITVRYCVLAFLMYFIHGCSTNDSRDSVAEIQLAGPDQLSTGSGAETNIDDADTITQATFEQKLTAAEETDLSRALQHMTQQKWKLAKGALEDLPPYQMQVLSNRILVELKLLALDTAKGPGANVNALAATIDRQNGKALENQSNLSERDLAALVKFNTTAYAAAPSHNLEGLLYLEKGRISKAERAFQRAVTLTPSYFEAWYNLGLIYDVYYQTPTDALPYYEKYLSLIPFQDEALVTWVNSLRAR